MPSDGQYHPCTMDIQFRWTESDYVAAQTAWLIRHPRSLGRSLIPLAMLAILLVVVPVTVALHPDRWRQLLPVLAWTGWPVGSYFIMRWRWRKNFAKSPVAHVDVLATIDERGITLVGQGEQKTHYWSGFSQIYESSHVVVFEKGFGDFVYLPKRAMSPGQLDGLKRLAASAPNCKVRLAPPLP